jgi:hypothetical protein
MILALGLSAGEPRWHPPMADLLAAMLLLALGYRIRNPRT